MILPVTHCIRDKLAVMIRVGFLIGLLIISSAAQAAHSWPLFFEHLNGDGDGASSSNVLIQDRQGFIWIGTDRGLLRYDGYGYLKYQNRTDLTGSLPDNYIYTLFEDSRGILWVGTENGLARFDQDTNSFTRFVFGHGNGQTVKQIISDGKGGMWLATREGLQHFDPGSGSFRAYRHDPSRPDSIATDNIAALALDNHGGLWLATWPGGIDYLAPGGQNFRHYRVDFAAHPDLRANNVRTLLFDTHHRLWIGTQVGLVLWHAGDDWSNRKSLDLASATHQVLIRQVSEDRKGTIWVSTSTQGLLRWNDDESRFIHYKHRPENPYSLPSNDINSVFVDRSGILWVGTNVEGTVRADMNIRGFEKLIPRDLVPYGSNTGNGILSIASDSNNHLWFGSGNGLTLMDTSALKVIKRFHADPKIPGSLSDDIVYSLYKAHDGSLWVGTASGLNRLDTHDGRFHVVHFKDAASDFVSHIAPGKGGILWLSTGGGLIRYDPVSGAIRQFAHDPHDPHSRSVNSTTVSLEDRAGRVWVGGTYGGGLDELDQATGRFRHYRHDPENMHGLNNDDINCMIEDKHGTLWVGTGKGINRIDIKPDGSVEFHAYPLSKLASGPVYSIQGDDAGKLWVSALAGLYKFDPVTGKTDRYFTSRRIFNGFYNSTSVRDGNGRLYFGSNNGITVVHPEAVNYTAILPQAVITDILIQNHSLREEQRPEGVKLDGLVSKPKALTLSWKNSVFSLEFSSLDYENPELDRYAYQLEGFDKSWVQVDANHRHASYTNMNPGKYFFHVKALNNAGLRSETTLPIIITPPFWTVWWFKLFVAAVMSGLALIAYRLRIARLVADQKRLEALVAARTIALEEMNAQLTKLSTIDGLTGISNRRHFDETLDSEWNRAKRFGQPISLIMLDVDWFKNYNDCYGHQAGDECLKRVAHSFAANVLRSSDLAARYGGEEFILIAPRADNDAAMMIAAAIQCSLDALQIPHAMSPLGRVTASIGVGTVVPSIHDTPEMLLRKVDQALFLAKELGRNRIVVA